MSKGHKLNCVILLLILILSLGFFLRVYNLSEESIWFDEACTLQSAEKPTLGGVLESVQRLEGNPPFYYLLMRYWIRIFGDSEFSARFPSVVFGTLSILIVFLIGKELFDDKTALASSLIMSASMLNILYSQEARTYSLFVMLAALSTLYFIKSLKQNRINVPYVILTIAVLYTHYLAILLLILQIFTYILFYKRFKLGFKKFLMTQIIVYLLYIPGIVMLCLQASSIQSALYGALSLKIGIPSFIARLGGLNFFIPFIIIFLILLILGLFKIDSYNTLKKIRFNQTLFFILLSILLVAYLIFSSHLTRSIFIIRYTLFVYPLFYILFARGFIKLRTSYKAIIALLFISVTIFSVLNYHLDMPKKEQWRDAAAFAEQNVGDDELVIVIHRDMIYPLSYYLKRNVTIAGIETYAEPSKNYGELIKLAGMLDGKKGYWLILSHAYKSQGIYEKYFNENYNLAEEKHLVGIDIYHYT